MKRIAAVVFVVLSLSPLSAGAEIQKNVTQNWPGKLMVGVRPLGTQILFTDTGLGRGVGYRIGTVDHLAYKLGLDFSGIIASPGKITVWLGGEVNVGGRGNLAFIEPGVFVQLTLEKLLKIPLVPLIRIGVSGPLYIPYGYTGAYLYGAFDVKVGVGAYYFLTKNIGVGAETHFAAGPSFYKDAGNNLFVGFNGFWDFMAGARFAF